MNENERSFERRCFDDASIAFHDRYEVIEVLLFERIFILECGDLSIAYA